MLKELPGGDFEGWRSAIMRAGYLALDRPDAQFHCKEEARGMSASTSLHEIMLKRLSRYLLIVSRLM